MWLTESFGSENFKKNNIMYGKKTFRAHIWYATILLVVECFPKKQINTQENFISKFYLQWFSAQFKYFHVLMKEKAQNPTVVPKM